jgi:arylsulfatase A-like enzyme
MKSTGKESLAPETIIPYTTMKPFRLHFTTLLLGVVSSLPIQTCFAVKQGEVPNVLLLIIDDLNTWQLQRAGRYAGKITTPNISAFADSGVSFKNAYTSSPKCSPSRTSFLSGVPPWKSGHTDNGLNLKNNAVLESSTTFLKEFQDAGYFIAQIGKVSHGYDIGAKADIRFAHRRDPAPPKAPFNGISKRNGEKVTETDWGPTHLDESEMNDTLKADTAVKALQMKHDKPFVITCGLFLPHMAWWIPQKYLDMYPLDNITLPPVKADDLNDIPQAGRHLIKGTYAAAIEKKQYKKAVQAYLGTTTYADTQMGRVLDALEASSYKDNTIVVLISDHGFHVGEKHHWQKGSLWEDGTNTLFMVRAPGVTKPKQVSETPVSLLDLYPTLMDLTGLETPKHVNGRSLVPLLKDIKTPHDYPVISAYQNHVSVRTDAHRLIRYGDGEMELYDSRIDPNEWTNLINVPEKKEVVKRLSALLPEFEMLPYARADRNKEKKKKKQ